MLYTWAGTREWLFTGMGADVGYEREAGCLSETAPEAGRPFAGVI
jgi:hypothetical protein